MTPPPSTRSADTGPEVARVEGNERLAIAAALLAGVLAPLNSTMIVVALPVMLEDLNAPLAWGSWIIVSYLIAMAAVQPLGGALGDRFGRRRVMLIGLAGFAVASVLAALAPSVEVLVLARTLQAVTGASAIPNGTALVRVTLPVTLLGRAFAVIGVGVGVAAALGPPLGGVIAGSLGWRWLFALNLLILAPALLSVARTGAPPARAHGARFDTIGATLLVATLVAGAASATLWRVPAVPALAVVALALAALGACLGLMSHLRRAREPVIDLDLLRRPGFLAAGLSVAASNLVMYTVFLAVPLLLTGAGWGPRDIGWLLGGMSLAMLAWGPVGGVLGDRVGRRLPALLGTGVAALAALALSAVTASWPWWAYAAAVTVLGSGLGLSSASVQAAAMSAAGAGTAGQAAGAFSTMRYLGSIVGSIVLSAVVGEAGALDAYRSLFGLVAAVSLCAVASAAWLPATSDRTVSSAAGKS